MSYSPFKILRRDADTSSVQDGQPDQLSTNSIGRLKVSTAPSAADVYTGTLTAAQTTQNTPVAGGTVAIDVTRISNVCFYVTGTFSATLSFDATLDGTNWFAIDAKRTNANTVEVTSGAITAAPVYAWETSVNGYSSFRVRASAFVSGTVNVRILSGSFATEPSPAVQTHAVTLTSTLVNAPSTSATTSPGLTVTNILTSTAASSNVVNLKATVGKVTGWDLVNKAATYRYLKFYNTATVPTMGTTAAIFQIALPPGGRATMPSFHGRQFATGIAYAITEGASLTDNTVAGIAVNDVIGIVESV